MNMKHLSVSTSLLLFFLSCSYHKVTDNSNLETSQINTPVIDFYSPSKKGPCSYAITRKTSGFPSYMSSVKKINVRIPSSNSRAPFPTIIIEPGFFSSEDNLDDIQNHYATHGFLVIGTNNTTHYKINTSSLDQYAGALLQTVRYAIESNRKASSILYGMIDTNAIGISGHSMGGGGTLMACDSITDKYNRYIKAAVAMNPFGKCQGTNIRIPVLLTASEHDSVLIRHMPGVSSSASDIYYSFQSIPEQTDCLFALFKNMKHNSTVDRKFFLSTSGNAPVFLPTMISWFKVHLANDNNYISYLDTAGTGYSSIKSRFSSKGEIPAYIYRQ